MALLSSNEHPTAIDGIPFNEASVGVDSLAEHTHANFHNAATVFKETNTPEGLVDLLVGEIDELLRELEGDSSNRVDIVAETGDLFHFWNDLFKLSGFSIESLSEHVGPGLVSGSEMMIDELKQAAAETHINQLNARNLLYELKALLLMRGSRAVDEELVGVIASHIFAVAAALDINVIYATVMKNLRNRAKYDPAEMNILHTSGLGYDDIRAEMVKRWENGRGDDEEFLAEFLAEFPLELSWTVTNLPATD